MKFTFENVYKYRKEFELACKEANASEEEYKQLISSKTKDDFMQVIFNNFRWINIEIENFQPKFDNAEDFYGGFAEVKLNDKWYIINRKGKIIREIKYRGIAISDGEMVYGSLIKKRNNVFAEWMIEDENGLGSDVVADTIGRYTGFKDKNGVEIYEGDIIQLCKNKNGSLQVELKNAYVSRWLLTHYSTKDWTLLMARKGYELEVIGNIYNHPELLDNLSERP